MTAGAFICAAPAWADSLAGAAFAPLAHSALVTVEAAVAGDTLVLRVRRTADQQPLPGAELGVTVDGRSIPLTAKEYALLEYFALHRGRLLGREEIAEHVWEETFDPFSNLIEVYVNRLRRKLGEEAGKPLLQTRRGSGYVLCDNETPGKKHAAQNSGGAKKSHV